MPTYQAGQPRLATITLTLADGTTEAALTVIAPEGTETAIAATTSGAPFLVWEAGDTYTPGPGEYIERWEVTGTGATTIDNTVWFGAQADATVSGQRVYATSADYAKLIKPTTAPTALRRALAVASQMVDAMLLTAVYAVDDDKMPTDTDVIAAMRDATCYQAEFASTTGDRNQVGAAKPSGFSIGKIAVQKANAGGSTSPGGVGQRGEWSPRAWERLAEAGLTGHEPWS